ncbi:MAG: polysaccharide deacetylase family protein [Actinobacteria bacterium]|nr:polysaccharide deacetylase family protein [Actinomycetota bacterium]
MSDGLFDEQIAYLARSYEIVPLGLLVRCIRENQPWPRRALAITLDDGYRDNYEFAYPILRKYEVPASVFLTAGYVDSGQLFWWDQVHHALMHSRQRRDTAELPSIYPAELRRCWVCGDWSSALELTKFSENVARALTRLPNELRLAVVDDLLSRMDVELSDVAVQDVPLSWAQVQEMASGGIDFGAHTLTHPWLGNIGTAQLEQEVMGAKALIEARLRRQVELFAYPGGSGAQNPRVHGVLRKAKFLGAATNWPGSNTLKTDPMLLRRWSATDGPVPMLAATLSGGYAIWDYLRVGFKWRKRRLAAVR